MKASESRLQELDVRKDFPVLWQTNRNKPLVYLDSASSAQKPLQVINAMSDFYKHDYANIHRGIYELSERSTKAYEDTRRIVQQFIHAKSDQEIVFVKGTTEAINLVSHSLGRANWQAGDEVIIGEAEHHANIVPWLLLKESIGIEIKVIPVLDDGRLDLEAYKKLFTAKTKLVAVNHASNVLGTINPVKQMTEIAHQHGALVLIDGAQAIAHIPVDVQEIDCDFYAFSAHKLYGPSGIGVLYAKEPLLDSMTPYQGGGDMIETVSFDRVTFAKGPQKFEAGTPAIANVVGLAAAIEYLNELGFAAILDHEKVIQEHALVALQKIPGLRIIGDSTPRLAVFSFVVEGIHPHDLATILDHEGIAIRAGHHCAMPLMKRFGVPATARVSFGIYNQKKDVDALVAAIESARRIFS